jgi:hypothetical protein
MERPGEVFTQRSSTLIFQRLKVGFVSYVRAIKTTFWIDDLASGTQELPLSAVN